ncbi:MAG: hypothetical protein N4A33_05565 [Bacteriovoracaceae bacterium]|jgi:predicted DNA-binding transcriptional regulator YafY|nr:hypothetical protein [Bacteriovoracaceae bacterium]
MLFKPVISEENFRQIIETYNSSFTCLQAKCDELDEDLYAYFMLYLDHTTKPSFGSWLSFNNEDVFELPKQATLSKQMIRPYLEECIEDTQSIEIESNTNKFQVLPLELLKFNGHIRLVYFRIDLCIVASINISDIYNITDIDISTKKPHMSLVDNYIKELRQMDGLEQRLVLKVKDIKSFDDNKSTDYFRNIYQVENSRNQTIWSASIEPSEEVYRWIFKQNTNVEILAPNDFKLGYLEFCQKSLNKIA